VSPAPCYLLSFPTRRSSDLGKPPLSPHGHGRCDLCVQRHHVFLIDLPDRGNLLISLIIPGIIVEKVSHRINPCLFEYLPALFTRSEEHTSELQSRFDLVCRL